jgi:ADP-heptose:LPS heptosyltransferase
MISEDIYVLVGGGLGDCLLTTPALKSLKINNPSRKLIVACSRFDHRDILKGNPFIDEYFPLEAYESSKDSIFWRYSMYSLYVPSVTKSYCASRIICEDLQTPFYEDNLLVYFSEQDDGFGKQMVLEHLGGEAIRNRGVIAIAPNVVSSSNKHWGLSNWSELISMYKDYSFFQLGSSGQEVIPGARDLSMFSLREQMSILSACQSFIGLDSFWSHCASALDVSGVVLFSDSTPVVWGHKNHLNLYKSWHCSPCVDLFSGMKCPYGAPCSKSITPSEVSAALDQFL